MTLTRNVGDTISSGVNYASDKVNEAISGTSKEANKSSCPLLPTCSYVLLNCPRTGVAKDSHASLGDRASGAKGYVKDSVDEQGHSVRAMSLHSPLVSRIR